MNLQKRILSRVLVVVTFLISACQFLNDGGTEIPNELTGSLYLPGGTPSANAEVILYSLDYVPGDSGSMTKRTITRTDGTGHFRFTDVPSGRYHVFGRQRLPNSEDSVFALSDSILFYDGIQELPPDTLRHPGSLSGTVQLRPEDDPRTARVQLLGTDYSCSVDSDGRFQLPRVAQGAYPIRIIAALPNYAPGMQQVTVRSGGSDTLPNVLVLTYPKHFAINSSTVALWTFDSANGGANPNQGSVNGFQLSPSKSLSYEATPFGFAAVLNDTGQYFTMENSLELTVGSTGRITYEARIYVDQYPTDSLTGGATVISMGPDLNMLINPDGSLQIGTRKANSRVDGYEYLPVSEPGVIPLKRWVDVAIALDQMTNQCYGYVDGNSVPLTVSDVNTDPFRVSKFPVFIGNNSFNRGQFKGKIDEIRVSNSLILGEGPPLTRVVK